MLSLHNVKPLNRWDHDSIRPGVVGSVGDTLLQVRLKHDCPEAAIRWGANAHEREPRLGANISDGNVRSYTGGKVAATHDSNWGWRDSFKTSRGWIHQDIRAPDRRTEPTTGTQPQYDWYNRLATVQHAKVSGNFFLPLPGGYGPAPGAIPRGGNAPRITDIVQMRGAEIVSGGSIVTGPAAPVTPFLGKII
jgi:hypothetical protein